MREETTDQECEERRQHLDNKEKQAWTRTLLNHEFLHQQKRLLKSKGSPCKNRKAENNLVS